MTKEQSTPEVRMTIHDHVCVISLDNRVTKKAALTYLDKAERAAIEAIPVIEKTVFASEDFQEGIQSFVERREARFQGR